MVLHVNDDPAGTQEKLVAHTLSEHKTEGLHSLKMLQHCYSMPTVPDIKNIYYMPLCRTHLVCHHP